MRRREIKEMWAIRKIGRILGSLNGIEIEINEMKAELGKAGYQVEFYEENSYLNTCRVFPKGEPLGLHADQEIVTRAARAESDRNIPLLGKYLALKRAHNIVILDNREG